MNVSRLFLFYKRWNVDATKWLDTHWGRRARLGLLGGTVVAYPLVSLIMNGPLVNQTFPLTYELEPLPQYLEPIVKQEYEIFLKTENRKEKDAVFKYDLLKCTEERDTVYAGSLGVRTGLRMALPFYTRFTTVEEALQYFKNLDELTYLGERFHIDWDTPTGQELAETFVLSEKAKHFLILRDFIAFDGYSALAQKSISWATWTCFTSIFTYWLHRAVGIFGGTAASFVGIYVLFIAAAWFANKQWYYLYRFFADVHADSVSAHTSIDHSEGGREFYWKMLKRNRLFRDLSPTLYTKVKLSGDIRGIPTSLMNRYDHVKCLNDEDDELKELTGEDF